jgi:hypothetical protein
MYNTIDFCMRINFFCVTLLAQFVRKCESDEYSDYLDMSRLASGRCVCPCDPRRDSSCRYMTGKCYQPICPIGTYLCCVFCQFSTCVASDTLAESTRGKRECLLCPPGHYCNGCDIPTRCPDNTINPYFGMSREAECSRCQLGFTATRDSTRCCYNDKMCSASPEGWNYLSSNSVHSIHPSFYMILLMILMYPTGPTVYSTKHSKD